MQRQFVFIVALTMLATVSSVASAQIAAACPGLKSGSPICALFQKQIAHARTTAAQSVVTDKTAAVMAMTALAELPKKSGRKGIMVLHNGQWKDVTVGSDGNFALAIPAAN